MAAAMASELTGRPVRGDIAMTGEITLSGRVLPVGGIKEKVLAARRVGIREVILPKQNAKNVNEDLTPELRQDLTVHLVSTIDEVLALALQPVSSDVRPADRRSRKDEGKSEGKARPAVDPPSLASLARAEGCGLSRSLVSPARLPSCTSSTRRATHRYRAARLSHPQVPTGSRPPPRRGRHRSRRRHRAGAGDLGRARARPHARLPRQDARRHADRRRDVAQLELPWSREMVEGFRLMVGGTIEAALRRSSPRPQTSAASLGLRVAIAPIGGGLHHAFPEPRRRLLPVQRRRGRGPRASARRHRARAIVDSTCTTATARRSSSSPIRASSPSRCTSSTTIRCGSRAVARHRAAGRRAATPRILRRARARRCRR